MRKSLLKGILRGCGILVLLMFFAISGLAQSPDLEPARQGSPVPIVAFNFVWNSAKPAHFSVVVESTGTAAYRADDSSAKSDSDTSDPYILKFVVSEPTRSQIFALAKEANYFKGNFDYTKTRIAQTGAKTLTYTEDNITGDFDSLVKGKENQTSYNWSENSAIQKLTKIFQDMSSTFELGRVLDFKRRFDKLGLDSELKRAEEMQKDGQLQQLQVIAPVLKAITNDVGVMHIARERAKRLLAAADVQQTAGNRNP